MLVYGRFPSVGSITVIVLISAITLFIGFWIFNKNKYTFAELV
jgi:ABC-type polysaccharide/polyol phosphate export permease